MRREDHFQEDGIDFWPSKLTLKTENVQFLTVDCSPKSKDLTGHQKNQIRRLI